MDGASFEQHVKILYEAQGFTVVQGSLLQGQECDLIATKYVEAVGPVRVLIECKYRSRGTVGNQDVYDFIAFCNALATQSDYSKFVMVTNARYTKDAYAAAAPLPKVSLLTVDAVESVLVDPSEAYYSYVNRYEEEEIFQTYISLQAAAVNDYGRRQRDCQIDAEIDSHLHQRQHTLLTVLGDFGAGKTTLLRRTKYRYAHACLSDIAVNPTAKGQQALRPLRPVLFLLKDFHEFKSLNEFIQATVFREFGRHTPVETFKTFCRQGKLLLLLDGFDEIANKSDRQSRLRHFVTISELFTLGSPTLLTCRTSYFVSHDEYRAALREATSSSPIEIALEHGKTISKAKLSGKDIHTALYHKYVSEKRYLLKNEYCDVYELLPINEDQIIRFLSNFDLDFTTILGVNFTEVYKFIRGVYDLSDLITRPILLSMIKDSVLEGKFDVRQQQTTISAAKMYSIYTSIYLDRDWHKGDIRKHLTREQRAAFATTLALVVLDRGDLSVSYAQIVRVMKLTFGEELGGEAGLDNLTVEQAASDLQICAFLTRSGKDSFRFLHKSFFEFFAARHIFSRLLHGRIDSALLQPLEDEILYFLGGFALDDHNTLCLKTAMTLQHPVVVDIKRPVTEGEKKVIRGNLAGALLHAGIVRDGEYDFRNILFPASHVKRLEAHALSFIECHFPHSVFSRSAFTYVKFVSCKGNIIFDTCRASSCDWSLCTERLDVDRCTLDHIDATFHGDVTNILKSRWRGGRLSVVKGDTGVHKCIFDAVTVRIMTLEGSRLSVTGSTFQACEISQAIEDHWVPLRFEDCDVMHSRLQMFISEASFGSSTFENCSGYIGIRGKGASVAAGRSHVMLGRLVVFNVDQVVGDQAHVEEVRKAVAKVAGEKIANNLRQCLQRQLAE